ncbi:MAG: endopeptidase La [Ruminococcus sp.]|nr:endopeptidase La [Ruminococcus sp.]
MLTVPIYDLLVLPGVTFFFKNDMFPGEKITAEQVGQDILFIMVKSEKARTEFIPEDIYPIGISGKIEGVDEEGNVRIRSKERVEISDLEMTPDGVTATAAICLDLDDLSEKEEKQKFEKIKKEFLGLSRQYQWGAMARSFILQWKNLNELAGALSPYMTLSWDEKYEILENDSRKERSEKIEEAVYELLEVFRVGEEAEVAQKEKQESSYREMALKKQIEFLQQQLDDLHPENETDVRKFEKKINESKMNPEARKEAEKVLNRMKQEGKDGHEYGMLYDYLDFVTSLSWETKEVPEIDLVKAEEILDSDHFGLKKIKERIIQEIAVMKLNKKQAGSILLFVGPPGTGKTSIGQSIAKALQREYVRISLGGIRDEAEIRGHRRTYVGAMPGRIMEGIKRSGVKNPVVILDEVDKLAKEFSGDPASALLEVLDPEQNFSFTDHYMNVPYDLSDVFFICTANSMDTIPEPLLNRMEVISFSGYTAIEKFHIARKHLLPKSMKEMGLKAQNLKVTDGAIEKIIEEYTAESGVRSLKKQMDVLCRNVAVRLVKGEQKSFTISEKRVKEFLGKKAMHHEKCLECETPGVSTGLAWTSAGGAILFMETMFTPGKGEIKITGQLGDVMKESAQIAVTLIKSLYPEMAEKLTKNNLHIHVPAGAVPKDGPSAGITLVTALASLVTGKVVDTKLAMTGEISLRGEVMPIGGLPEKLMAAQRAGIEKVLIPYENVEDLEDVAEEVKNALEIIPVRRIQEVLHHAFLKCEE